MRSGKIKNETPKGLTAKGRGGGELARDTDTQDVTELDAFQTGRNTALSATHQYQLSTGWDCSATAGSIH